MSPVPSNGAIIGQGNAGSALEKGLQQNGYETKTVGKEPERVQALTEWGEVIILAIPFPERSNAVDAMGDAVDGKILVDVTNALSENSEYASSLEESGAEELQAMVPDATVVKCFNTVFSEHMPSGKLEGDALTVFAASDDEEARETVVSMAREIGFDAVDAGPLEKARWLEPLGYLNMQLAFDQDMGTNIGFRLVR